MIISGHQPCYLPWVGVFHKLELSDVFVYMDTVQYLCNDWNNRNLIRVPDGSVWLTVPIDNQNSKGKMLNQIAISSVNHGRRKNWQTRHWETIKRNYKKAPYFPRYCDELEAMYTGKTWTSLVALCWEQFNFLREHFELGDKKIVRMSEKAFDGKKSDLILDHCLKLNGKGVVLGENGANYIDIEKFKEKRIKLFFQHFSHPVYEQRYPNFVPKMSALDLLLNHGPESRSIFLRNNISYRELRTGKYWAEYYE